MDIADPIYRLVPATPPKNLLARIVRFRLSGHDLGAAVSLLLVLFGFRRTREVARDAVQQIAAGVGGLVRSASWAAMRRSESMEGFFERQLSGSRALGGSRAQHPSTATFVQHGAAPAAQAHDQDSPQDGPMRWTERVAANIMKRLDSALLTTLATKLALLALFTMPLQYFFGAKRSFLRWASRSGMFRLYLRLSTTFAFALVAAATAAVKFAHRPLQHSTVQRWRALALLNTVLSFCTLRLFELIRGDPAPFIFLEESAQDRDLLSVEPPSQAFTKMTTWLSRKLTPPVFLNLEEIPPERSRLLFVGNHVIWGLDVPVLLHCLYAKQGIFARPLGEHSWFSLPVVGEVMKYIGAIDGTRHNCDLLMERGANLLVYPGGARESWKRTTDEKYAILWAEHHVGFVHMALRHGYTIVPVASVGTEDVFEPVVDLPIRRILTLGDVLPTPKKGTSKAFDSGARLPVVMPRILKAQRMYFRFMPAIRTAEYQGQENDIALVTHIRDETRRRLQTGIDELKDFRESDPERFVFQPSSRL